MGINIHNKRRFKIKILEQIDFGFIATPYKYSHFMVRHKKYYNCQTYSIVSNPNPSFLQFKKNLK